MLARYYALQKTNVARVIQTLEKKKKSKQVERGIPE